jgi:hypothetical protein
MAHIQFQDVLRQRLEHAQSALIDMRDHLMHMSTRQDRLGLDGLFDTTFETLLKAHLNQYSMARQLPTLPLPAALQRAITAGQPSSCSD